MTEGILIRFRLVGEEAEALRALSATEMRSPRDQTHFILRRELVQRRFLPTDLSTQDRPAETQEPPRA